MDDVSGSGARNPGGGAAVSGPVRILHLEDSPLDGDLVLAKLQRDGFSADLRRVDSANKFLSAITSDEPFDLILSDYFLPDFDGMSALRLTREHRPQTPFIFVSGVLGEENAIDSLKFGATDYVLKQRLDRLVPSIRRALAETQERTARRQAERQLRRSQQQMDFMLDALRVGRWELDLSTGRFNTHSDLHDQIVCGGPCPDDWDETCLISWSHPEDRPAMLQSLAKLREDGGQCVIESRMRRPNGKWDWVWIKGVRMPGNTHAAGLVIDITARKTADEERERLLHSEREARAEAERAGRLKDDFLATLSHELRSPLNAVLGWTQLLKRKAIPPAEVANAVSIIERNAKLQGQLVEDLLDMSRITSGKLRLETQRVDLVGVARLALEAICPSAESRNLTLVAALPEGEVPVRGDPARLQQIIWNLLSNAVKFTDKGGRIEMTVAAEDSTAVVRIADNGQGIDPQFLPHMFGRFRQQDGSAARKHGGLGVGLSIVRHLVELHGGHVAAYSDGRGSGATFAVMLPLMKSAGGANADGDEVRLDPPDLTGATLLIVDDEDDTRDYIRRVLEDCNAEVIGASNAADGLTLLVKHRPALLLSDLGMPGQDGYEFIRKIRALPATQGCHTRAVAVTAYARVEDRQRALGEGFDMHLSKPIDPSRLLDVVSKMLRPEWKPPTRPGMDKPPAEPCGDGHAG